LPGSARKRGSEPFSGLRAVPHQAAALLNRRQGSTAACLRRFH